MKLRPKTIKAIGLGTVFLTIETYIFALVAIFVRQVTFLTGSSEPTLTFIAFALLPFMALFAGTIVALAGYAMKEEPSPLAPS